MEDFLKNNYSESKTYDKSTIEDLKWSLKIELSSYYFSDQARYILSTYKDNDVEKALKALSN